MQIKSYTIFKIGHAVETDFILNDNYFFEFVESFRFLRINIKHKISNKVVHTSAIY
jgi:hypothetical protein